MLPAHENRHYRIEVVSPEGDFWDDHMMAHAQYAICNKETGVVEARLCSLPSAITTADRFSEFLAEMEDSMADVVAIPPERLN